MNIYEFQNNVQLKLVNTKASFVICSIATTVSFFFFYMLSYICNYQLDANSMRKCYKYIDLTNLNTLFWGVFILMFFTTGLLLFKKMFIDKQQEYLQKIKMNIAISYFLVVPMCLLQFHTLFFMSENYINMLVPTDFFMFGIVFKVFKYINYFSVFAIIFEVFRSSFMKDLCTRIELNKRNEELEQQNQPPPQQNHQVNGINYHMRRARRHG